MDSHIRKLDTRISNKESELNALYTKIQKFWRTKLPHYTTRN